MDSGAAPAVAGATQDKRPITESAGASHEPPAKKVMKVEFKVPAPKTEATVAPLAAPAAGVKVQAAPATHSDARVGTKVAFDGGYRDPSTGRWVGSGSWSRLWDGIDTGSWDGSHYYGVPDNQQEDAAKNAAMKARAATSAPPGAEVGGTAAAE